jgi:hypothetical protein
MWTKETAISELETLINQIDSLKARRRFSADHTEWLMKIITFLEEVFGVASIYYGNLRVLPWQRTGTIITDPLRDPEGMNFAASIERQHQEAYRESLDTAKGILRAALDQLRRAENIDSLYQGKDTPPESSIILKVINIAERKLRKVIHQAPAQEKEVQDAFEGLLIGADIQYSRETERIEYSSKSYVPDFVIDRIDLAIEIKLCAREGREKEIISEINDDILAYQTKRSNLFFIVYDTGYIRDVDRFMASFEQNDKVIVRVVKH